LGQLIIIVALLALLWLLMIRPARRRQVAQHELLAGIEVGDEILSAGGLYGHVREIDGDELLVEVAPDIRLRMARRAVAAIIEPEGDESLEGDIIDGEIVDDHSASAPDANDRNRG
jgi:preprotein translocase subunit YajC